MKTYNIRLGADRVNDLLDALQRSTHLDSHDMYDEILKQYQEQY